MNNQTIADIYQANDNIHEKLTETVADLSDEQANFPHGGKKWTIAGIVEHIAIVKDGMTKISGKLIAQAQIAGGKADGAAVLSDNFKQKSGEIKDLKLEAPERVRPTGKRTIAESLEKIEESRRALEDLRPLFETVECSEVKFPHPFMGDLTAHEWLILVGGHEARHLRQIKNLLEKST